MTKGSKERFAGLGANEHASRSTVVIHSLAGRDTFGGKEYEEADVDVGDADADVGEAAVDMREMEAGALGAPPAYNMPGVPPPLLFLSFKLN